MTILYVDDDADDRHIFQEAVKSIDARFTCITAQDGLDALSYLSDNKLPDIIFLDINMPLMDGKTCLGELRGNKHTAHIPVIMFTTSNNPEERSMCENLGANDFVLKPVSYLHMREIIASILSSTNAFPADNNEAARNETAQSQE
jgi:CheY-like chemotaxis protein